ncbi:hypothetical protein GCM10028818_22990 [Spirosoma horti]
MVVAFLFLHQATVSLGQRRSKASFIPYSSVSVGAGTSTYFGDLAGYSLPIKTLTTLPRWNVGLGYTRQMTPHFAIGTTFTWVRIVGDDYTYSKNDPTRFEAQYIRNLHFRNDIKEAAVKGIYNFVEDGRNPNFRAALTPYLFAGLAFAFHNPEARTPTATNGNNGDFAAREWVKLQLLHTEGQGNAGYDKPYSLVTLAVPVGFGMRYRLNRAVNLGFEVGFRFTFTNYLDDVGGTYPKQDVLTGLSLIMSDRRFEYDAARVNTNRYTVAQEILQTNPAQFTTENRGSNGLQKDSYLLTNLSIHYIIPTQIKCPSFSRR